MKSLEERLEYKFEKLQQKFQELQSINTNDANVSCNKDEYKTFLKTENCKCRNCKCCK